MKPAGFHWITSMSLVILVTLAAPRSSRGADPDPASGCDVLVDVTHTPDPVAAVQAQLNRWNLFSDENGDRDNDRLHLCIAGRMKLDASMARRRHRPVLGGTAPGPIRSIFSVAPAHDTGPGSGIERGLPVACIEKLASGFATTRPPRRCSSCRGGRNRYHGMPTVAAWSPGRTCRRTRRRSSPVTDPVLVE